MLNLEELSPRATPSDVPSPAAAEFGPVTVVQYENAFAAVVPAPLAFGPPPVPPPVPFDAVPPG